MLKKGIGRVKPWQRGGPSMRSKANKVQPPKHDLPPHFINGIPSYAPPQMQIPYGYPVIQHAYQPPQPPPHHHQKEHNHHKNDQHKKKDDYSGKNHGHHEHHPPPPPPPPGYIKRIFQYILDTIKKRPIVAMFLLTNGVFYTYRKLNPEIAEKQMIEVFDALRKTSTSWDVNAIGSRDIIKITKLNDSLNNYSNSFKKASSGMSVSNAMERLQTASVLKHMKELESILSEEKRQEISRLTDAFQRDNARLTAALGTTASQLRHCQLSGIASASDRNSNNSSNHNHGTESSGDSSGSSSVILCDRATRETRDLARKADAAAREQSNTTLQNKYGYASLE